MDIFRLVELIKMSVGLGTKGATAHVITALTHQCPLDLQQYTGKILSALFTGLSDRNPAVRKTYASAIGQVIKVIFTCILACAIHRTLLFRYIFRICASETFLIIF